MDKSIKNGVLADFKAEGDFTPHINKIINLHYFRKLSGKTQVILSLTGPSVRTRLTHTVEVARIARDICEELGLNADLAEAISLAHDIGHTPFGHVGERTLREIMCGCDTLEDKIRDLDFDNSGFKHNLQSFRVLMSLEPIVDDPDPLWPYILWGVLVHSKMSYSKQNPGMENDIYISCKHCDWVYSCFYHEKRECKRNILEKKRKDTKETIETNEICKPWYCANLATNNKKEDIAPERIKPGQTTEEYLSEKFIKEDLVRGIYCSKKCYLAKLAEYKIQNKGLVRMFPYLFDHPFPNSFYAKYLYKYFNNSKMDFVSVEAQVVMQADEIAQRQQDLEDAVSTRLISFERAQGDVSILWKGYNPSEQDEIVQKCTDAKNQKELGEIVVKFYKKRLIESTIKNFKKFYKNSEKTKVNIYCLLNILYSFEGQNKRKKKAEWLLKELTQSPNRALHVSFNDHFDINLGMEYLYFIVYDLLDNDLRLANYDIATDVLEKFKNCLKQKYPYEKVTHEDNEPREKRWIRDVDSIRIFLKDTFPTVYSSFIDPSNNNHWKNLSRLNLHIIFLLDEVFQKYFSNKGGIFTVNDLLVIDLNLSLNNSPDIKKTFKRWKTLLKADANTVLANIVSFINEDDTNPETKKEALKDFHKQQKSYILKSEMVEKNDGKSSYILKRLFLAFVTNSHQLPDEGLINILISLKDDTVLELFIANENETFSRILRKLKKTVINGDFEKIETETTEDFMAISNDDYKKIKKSTSNEIVALIESKKDLYDFIKFFKEIKAELGELTRSKEAEAVQKLAGALLKFRAILDNPILNAMPYWKSLLTRGICDYIASLTDQEAINQYEKLYASVMEIV